MPDSALRLDGYLPYRLSVASNAVSRLIARAYEDRFGLTIPQWRLIAVLAEDGPLTQQAIGARTVMDKVTVSRATQGLVKRRLVQRAPHDADGRSHHLALGTNDIYDTVQRMRARGMRFQDTVDTYFDGIDARVPGHGENVQRLRENRILIDGAPTEGQGLLLQIFTENAIGPIFFEIIQRKGNEGFGEGNFKALFESLELDQIRRGVLTAGRNA